MSNLHRIQWMDARIRAGRFPNARTLAERFEISQRQAARDIEYLRYSMGAPLAYSAEKNGYYYEDQAFALPAMYLSEDDKQTLSYLALQYRNMGSENAVRLGDILARLTGEAEDAQPADDEPIHLFDIEQSGIYLQLHKSMVKMTKIAMRYCDRKNEITERIFCPYKLINREGADYVAGYCEMRKEIRTFRIDRIRKITELHERFQIAEDFDPVHLDENLLFRMRQLYWATVRFQNLTDSSAISLRMEPANEPETYRIGFYDSSEILSELIRQPANFKIIAPNWLREKLRRKLANLTENLGTE